MISPMCQVSVGRHETCSWVECTCWCHSLAAKKGGGESEAPVVGGKPSGQGQRKTQHQKQG
jgi:hypothetical protein